MAVLSPRFAPDADARRTVSVRFVASLAPASDASTSGGIATEQAPEMAAFAMGVHGAYTMRSMASPSKAIRAMD